MKNVLDIDILSLDFSLNNYIEEDGCIPKKEDVILYQYKLVESFNKYQEEFKYLLQDKNTLTEFNRIIFIDVILFYIYYLYTDSSEEAVDSNFNINEEEIISSWSETYLEELEYPKILKLYY